MKVSRRELLAGASCAALFSGKAHARFPHGSANAIQSFKPIKVGGGGYMRTIDISPDGSTVLCNSDVIGCYLYDSVAGAWNDTFNLRRGITVTNPGNYASYGMASAPSQPTTIYNYANDSNLWRSLDRGASWVKLANFGPFACSTNDGPTRLYAPRIMVDPVNPDVVYIGTPANGVIVTLNGTQTTPTFAPVAGISAANNPDGYVMTFDPGGGSSGAPLRTNVAYICSIGVGVYEAKTLGSGGGFTLTTSGPGGASHMRVAPTTRILYACDLTSSLHKYTPGSPGVWSTVSPGVNAFAVAIDPDPTKSGARVVVADIGGSMAISQNSGGAWTALGGPASRLSPDIPWLSLTSQTGAIGDIIFDPSKTNFLMQTDGIGIWTCNGLPNSGAYNLTSQTKGIENLQTNGVVISPSATRTPIGYCWDRSIIAVSNRDTYSAVQQPYAAEPFGLNITMTWGVDWASSDKKTLVSTGFFEAPFLDVSATSSDNGATWSFLPAASDAVWTLATNAQTIANGTNNTLSFAGPFPFPTSYLMQIANATNPSSISAGTYLTASNGSTLLTLSKPVAATVNSGDTITLKFASSPSLRALRTSAASATGSVLHFGAGNVPAYIIAGMFMSDNTDSSKLVGGGAPAQVLSINYVTGDVTMNQAVQNGGPLLGDLIFFYWEKGGDIAVSSPTNWIVNLGQNASFPAVTADGGATWNYIDIAGVPRIGTCTVTNGSDVVSNLSFNTSNLVVGGSFNNSLASFPPGTTVGSIINSTSFHASTPATGVGSALDLFLPETGWGHANYLDWKLSAADRVTASTLYKYNTLTGKVYVSSSGGANGTWSVANSVNSPVGNTNLVATFGMNGGQYAAMKSVPYLGGTNTAGHLFMTNGFFAGGPFIRSTDGGATWTAVALMSGVGAFGFGAAKPAGGGYPAIRVWGTYNGVLGNWQSDDNAASFFQIGTDTYPMGIPQPCSDIDGDKVVYGDFNYAMGEGGWIYYG